VKHLVAPHSHDSADKVDAALEAVRRAAGAVDLAGRLGVTAALQAVVVAWSGSVALLGDTLHNVADALTAVPLGSPSARPAAADPAYTYGYGGPRTSPASSIVSSSRRPRRRRYEAVAGCCTRAGRHLGAVAVAAVIGFVGNEAVARYASAVGRGSARRRWSRTGCTRVPTGSRRSPCCSARRRGARLGWADPVVGLLITVAILFVLRDAARQVYRRLMDAVDPHDVDASSSSLRHTGASGRRQRAAAAGSGTSCAPSATSWSTPTCRWWRRTRSRWTPSTG
jgi:hypothetical protein